VIGAMAMGEAQAAIEITLDWVTQRQAFGEPLWSKQTIRQRMAMLASRVEAGKQLVYHAAWLKDTHPGKLGAASSKAKLYASEMVNRVVAKAVQIHGSQGYSRESDVERMYRDARVVTIYEGTSEIQRTIIARDLLGKS